MADNNYKHDQFLYELSNNIFLKIYRTIYPTVNFPKSEWEDIKSEAIIRIFKKRHLYRKKKGSWPQWVKFLISNSIKNSVRDRLGDKKYKNCSNNVSRRNIKFPEHLIVKIKQVGILSSDIIVIEPDGIDENEDFLFDLEKNELEKRFYNLLNDEQKTLIRLLAKGKNLKEAAESMNIKYHSIIYMRDRLKEFHKQFINNVR